MPRDARSSRREGAYCRHSVNCRSLPFLVFFRVLCRIRHSSSKTAVNRIYHRSSPAKGATANPRVRQVLPNKISAFLNAARMQLPYLAIQVLSQLQAKHCGENPIFV